MDDFGNVANEPEQLADVFLMVMLTEDVDFCLMFQFEYQS